MDSEWWKRIEAPVALLSAVVGVVAAFQALGSKVDADKSAKAATAQKMALDQHEDDRATRDTQVRYDNIAYEAVVKVLELDRDHADIADKRVRAVMALVNVTASDSMKPVLFDVIGQGAGVAPAIRQDATNAAAALRQLGDLSSEPAPAATRNNDTPPPTSVAPPPKGSAVVVPSSASLKGYRVEVFSCPQGADPVATAAQAAKAQALAAEMNARADQRAAGITWATKELPEVINAVPGYRVDSNQLRYNPADGEESNSVDLKALAESSQTLQNARITLERRVVRKRTPNYLSIFLCGVRAG